MNIKWIIVCCFLLVSSIYSNINTTQPISDIKFVGLTSSLAKQAVESLTLQTLSNSTASLRQLKADIHTIYQTGYFSEVTINSGFTSLAITVDGTELDANPLGDDPIKIMPAAISNGKLNNDANENPRIGMIVN